MDAARRRICRAVALALMAALVSIGQPGSGAAQWVDERVSGPFVCRAEFPLSSVDDLLGELAQLQNELVRYLGVSPAREPIELYLFRDQPSYRRYLSWHLGDVPYRRALYVKDQGPGKVLAYRSRAFEIDVRHECTHALLHATLPVVPLWLDEGLAEYFELPPPQRAYDNPHLGSLRWNLRLGMVPRLEGLEKKGGMSEMGRAEYRCCWAWVHFMLHGPRAAHDELVRYLRELQASTPPGLLSERLEQRLPKSRQRLAAHFRRWKR